MRPFLCVAPENTKACKTQHIGAENSQDMKKERLTFRIISLVVASVFMCTTIVWSAPSHPVYSVAIQSKDGTVKERWKNNDNEPGEDKPVVVHIQDAHASFDAQENIARVIDHFIPRPTQDNASGKADFAEKPVLLVCTEGAYGTCDTSRFSTYPDQDVRTIVARQFLREGKFSGAEYGSIISGDAFSLYGAETRSLYKENYEAYCAVVTVRDGLLDEINAIENILHGLKVRDYSDALLSLMACTEDYQAGSLDIVAFIALLLEHANAAGIDVLPFVNIALFYETVQIQNSVSPAALSEERLRLEAVLEKTGETAKWHEEFEKGKIGEKDYYTYLRNAIRENDSLEAVAYQHVIRYAAYCDKMARLDMTMLLYEIRELRWEIEHALARGAQVKDLVFLSQAFELLRFLINLQALSEDVDYFFKNRQLFHEAYLKSVLRRVAPAAYETVIENFRIDETLSEVERFYRRAEARNAALVENTLARYATTDKACDTVLLISGGYHSRGITAELRRRDVPYVVITPRIHRTEPDIPYEDRMLLKLTPFERMLSQPAMSTISFPLLSAQEPLIDWIGSVSDAEETDALSGRFSFQERQEVHERAVLMSLYIFGFIKFVLGDTAFENRDMAGVEFVKRVEPVSQRYYQEYLEEAGWSAAERVQTDIVFDRSASTSSRLSFLIAGRQVGIDLKTLFSAGIDSAASLSDIRLFDARMTDQQLTFLYQTIFNHLRNVEAERVSTRVQDSDQGGMSISDRLSPLSDTPDDASAEQLRGGQMPLLRNALEKWFTGEEDTELSVWQVMIEQVPWAVSQLVAFLFGFSPVSFSLLGIVALSFIGLHYVGARSAYTPPPLMDIMKVVVANAIAGLTAMSLAPFVTLDEIAVLSVCVLGIPGLYHFRTAVSPQGRPGRGEIQIVTDEAAAVQPQAEMSRRSFFAKAALLTTVATASLSAVPGLVGSVFAGANADDKELLLIKRYFKDAFPASAADSRALANAGYARKGYIQIGAFSDEKNHAFLRSVMENIPGLAIAELKSGGLYKIFVRIKKGAELKAEYEKVIAQISEYMQIDPDVVWHMIKKESRGDPFAVSSQNAHGISQVLPGTVDFVINQTRSRDSWQKKLDQMRAEGIGAGDPQFDFIQRMYRAYTPLDSIISSVYDDGERYGVSAGEVRETVKGLRDLGFYIGPLNLLFGMSYLAYITAEIEKSKALGRSEYSIVVTDPKTKKKTSKIISLPFDPNTETNVAAQMAYNTGLARIYRRVNDMGGWHNIFNTKAKGAYLSTETVDYAYQFMRDYSRMQAAKGKAYQVHPDKNVHIAMSLTALERSRMISTVDRDLKRVQFVPGPQNKKVEKHYKNEHAAYRNAFITVRDRAREGTLSQTELRSLIARVEDLPQWPLIKEMRSYLGTAIDNYIDTSSEILVASREEEVQPAVRPIQSFQEQLKNEGAEAPVASGPDIVREPLVNRVRTALQKRASDLHVTFAETVLNPLAQRFESVVGYALSIGVAALFIKRRARAVRAQETSAGRRDDNVYTGAAFDTHLRAFEQPDGYGFVSIDSDRQTQQVQVTVSTESVDMQTEQGEKAKAYVSGYYWKAWLLVRTLNSVLPLLFGSERIFLRPFQARTFQSNTASRFHFQVQVPRTTIFHLGLLIASVFTMVPLFYFFPAAVATGLTGYALARIVFIAMPLISSIESRTIRRIVYGSFLAAIITAGLHFSAQFSYAALSAVSPIENISAGIGIVGLIVAVVMSVQSSTPNTSALTLDTRRMKTTDLFNYARLPDNIVKGIPKGFDKDTIGIVLTNRDDLTRDEDEVLSIKLTIDREAEAFDSRRLFKDNTVVLAHFVLEQIYELTPEGDRKVRGVRLMIKDIKKQVIGKDPRLERRLMTHVCRITRDVLEANGFEYLVVPKKTEDLVAEEEGRHYDYKKAFYVSAFDDAVDIADTSLTNEIDAKQRQGKTFLKRIYESSNAEYMPETKKVRKYEGYKITFKEKMKNQKIPKHNTDMSLADDDEYTAPLKHGALENRILRVYKKTLTGGAQLRTRVQAFLQEYDKTAQENITVLDRAEIDTSGDVMLGSRAFREGYEITPLAEVSENLSFDILEKVISLAAEDDARTITVVDWGCGDGSALKDIAQYLAEKSITNVQLIGFSNIYYNKWEEDFGYENVSFILDRAENFKDYFNDSEIDFVFSHKGLAHLNSQDYTAHMQSISTVMSHGGIILHDTFGDQDNREVPPEYLVSDEKENTLQLINVSPTRSEASNNTSELSETKQETKEEGQDAIPRSFSQEPVYVFINETAVTSDTMRDFTHMKQKQLSQKVSLVPVFYSFDKDKKEIEELLTDLGKNDLRSLNVVGKEELAGVSAGNEKILLMLKAFDLIGHPERVIMIDKGKTKADLSYALDYVLDNNLGWIGLVDTDFPFKDIQKIKALAEEGHYASTIMTQVTYFMGQIQQGLEPDDSIAVAVAIADMSSEMQASLLATIEQIEKEVMVRQAA